MAKSVFCCFLGVWCIWCSIFFYVEKALMVEAVVVAERELLATVEVMRHALQRVVFDAPPLPDDLHAAAVAGDGVVADTTAMVLEARQRAEQQRLEPFVADVQHRLLCLRGAVAALAGRDADADPAAVLAFVDSEVHRLHAANSELALRVIAAFDEAAAFTAALERGVMELPLCDV